MSPTRPLLILKTGAAPAPIRERMGDFDGWIATGLREGGARAITVHDARADGAPLPPPPDTLAGIVITGSSHMVSAREPWSEALVPWLRQVVAQEVPVLGICYGHQLLAHALGGDVGQHPQGLEIGTAQVERRPEAADDPLLGALPERFAAQTVHWQSVRRLPPDAVLLAGNAHEPHHAFRAGRRAWGVQFHPEFSAPAMRAYADGLSQVLAREGFDARHVQDTVKPTPDAAALLPRFARLALMEPGKP